MQLYLSHACYCTSGTTGNQLLINSENLLCWNVDVRWHHSYPEFHCNLSGFKSTCICGFIYPSISDTNFCMHRRAFSSLRNEHLSHCGLDSWIILSSEDRIVCDLPYSASWMYLLKPQWHWTCHGCHGVVVTRKGWIRGWGVFWKGNLSVGPR